VRDPVMILCGRRWPRRRPPCGKGFLSWQIVPNAYTRSPHSTRWSPDSLALHLNGVGWTQAHSSTSTPWKKNWERMHKQTASHPEEGVPGSLLTTCPSRLRFAGERYPSLPYVAQHD